MWDFFSPVAGLSPGDVLNVQQFRSYQPLQIKVVHGVLGGSPKRRILRGEIHNPVAGSPRSLVALKVIEGLESNDTARELIRREVAAAGRAQHRHILPFIGILAIRSFIVLVSEFMVNGNLLDYLKARPTVEREPLVIMNPYIAPLLTHFEILQVALAVDYLHGSLKLVHGDITGRNVLISDDGRALLADFSLSTTTEESPEEDNTVTLIRNRYTPRFAAPELLAHDARSSSGRKRSKTTHTDVFAFAVLVVQTFAGADPWSGLDGSDPTLRVLFGERRNLPSNFANIGLTDSWWSLCLDCWEHQPTNRPSMGEIRSRIVTITRIELIPEPVQPEPDTARREIIALWLTSIGFTVGHVISVNQFSSREQLSIEIVSGVVGEGGTARVLKGKILSPRSLATPSEVAVKIIPRFLSGSAAGKELAAVKRVRHRYILPFLGALSTEHYTILVSPFMVKRNMLEYIESDPAANKGLLILQVAIAVDHLHRCEEIVHGDLKCQNVLISADGCAQLADFGLATAVEKPSIDATTALDIRSHRSTPFSAPELFTDGAKSPKGRKRSKTMQTDVFAFGMLVLQAFTESRPWLGLDAGAVESHVTKKRIPPRPVNSNERGLTDPWWKVCKNCWEFKPNKRPSMKQVQTKIHSILGISKPTGCIGRCAPE